MTINGVNYQVDIIGKAHDIYSSDGVAAPLTFQLHDCYETIYQMNTEQMNFGGWRDSNMRNVYMPQILNGMPVSVKNAIQEVNKMTSIGGGGSPAETTQDKLFLLSEVEIHGTDTYSVSGEGTQYAYYAMDGVRKRKNHLGESSRWWSRSPHSGSIEYNCVTDSSGNPYLQEIDRSDCVSFAFCF